MGLGYLNLRKFCFLQDRVEEVQAALEELALEKERLLRRNADLQAELQARAAPTPLAGSACNACGTPEAQQQLILRSQSGLVALWWCPTQPLQLGGQHLSWLLYWEAVCDGRGLRDVRRAGRLPNFIVSGCLRLLRARMCLVRRVLIL